MNQSLRCNLCPKTRQHVQSLDKPKNGALIKIELRILTKTVRSNLKKNIFICQQFATTGLARLVEILPITDK